MRNLFYGGSNSIPYGNLIDGLNWDYSEWQTITYEPQSCYWWNNKEWVGTAPENPAWTECGLNNCIRCDSQVLSEDVYVYVSKKILTPLAIQVLGTPHEALIVIKWMQYSTEYNDLYVDITLLTEGLTYEQIVMLRQTQDHAHEHYCCYIPGGTGNLGPV